MAAKYSKANHTSNRQNKSIRISYCLHACTIQLYLDKLPSSVTTGLMFIPGVVSVEKQIHLQLHENDTFL